MTEDDQIGRMLEVYHDYIARRNAPGADVAAVDHAFSRWCYDCDIDGPIECPRSPDLVFDLYRNPQY